MQVIVLKSPRLLRGVLRRLFGIRSNTAGISASQAKLPSGRPRRELFAAYLPAWPHTVW